MKTCLFYFFGLIAVACSAQPQPARTVTVNLGNLPKKKLIVRFEKVDTTDESGRHFEVSRSYYFDRERKNLLLITVNEKQFHPRTGFLVWYTFSDNKLLKVTTIPSKNICRQCSAEYYFSNDSLINKNEQNYSVKDINRFLDDSKKLSKKVLANGKMKAP